MTSSSNGGQIRWTNNQGPVTTTATSLSSSAKNLVRMTRWSLLLWDLRPS